MDGGLIVGDFNAIKFRAQEEQKKGFKMRGEPFKLNYGIPMNGRITMKMY